MHIRGLAVNTAGDFGHLAQGGLGCAHLIRQLHFPECGFDRAGAGKLPEVDGVHADTPFARHGGSLNRQVVTAVVFTIRQQDNDLAFDLWNQAGTLGPVLHRLVHFQLCGGQGSRVSVSGTILIRAVLDLDFPRNIRECIVAEGQRADRIRVTCKSHEADEIMRTPGQSPTIADNEAFEHLLGGSKPRFT